jgi:hypothetical protein
MPERDDTVWGEERRQVFAGTRKLHFNRHCERSEAIQRSMHAAPGLLRRFRSSQ